MDLALAGGSEAPFSHGHLKAWEAMRVVAPDTCRPFSADRRGLILGEGGAMLVLEPLEAARARGARVYAELSGFGMSSDAHHATQPTVAGPARAMRGALADAKLSPEQVGYVNAHGTGTRGNDAAEARAIREVFGAHTDRLAVSSTKSMHGHALGAAGALEAVATVLALAQRDSSADGQLHLTGPRMRPRRRARPRPRRHAPGGALELLRVRWLNAVLAFRGAGIGRG